MPLNVISRNLQGILYVNLTGPLSQSQLASFFNQAHVEANKQFHGTVPVIVSCLNDALRVADMWLMSDSKRVLVFSNQASFDLSGLKGINAQLLAKYNSTSQEVESILNQVSHSIDSWNSLIMEGKNIDQRLKSQPFGILQGMVVGAANTIGSGVVSLGQSIGHFFTHGSFSQVNSSPGNASKVSFFQHQAEVDVNQMLVAINQLVMCYRHLQGVLTHISQSIKDAINSLEGFEKNLNGLNASDASKPAQGFTASMNNSMTPVKSLVATAMQI